MSDWPNRLFPAPKIISSYSTDSYGGSLGMLEFITAPSSAAVVQNKAYYTPFVLEQEAIAVKMCCINGATINGNLDLGIYDAEWNYLISSGSTAQAAGANAIQEFDITDTTLPPGYYWMAIASNSASATLWRFGIADEIAVPQVAPLTQASAFPLPTTTATPVKSSDTTVQVGFCMAVSFNTLI